MSLRRRLAAEQGFLMPIAVWVLFLLLLLLAAALTWATGASDSAIRDQNEKAALQAAQAGMRMAVYEANGLGLDVSQIANPNALNPDLLPGQCVVSASLNITKSIQTPVTGGSWCSPVRGQLGAGQTYCYQIGPLATATVSLDIRNLFSVTLSRTIVASGSAGGATRWVSEQVSAPLSVTQGGLSSLLSLVLSTTKENLVLYKPVAGTYTEAKPTSGAPSGGFSCP
jgi:type II secretory pathway pseudopilin PulG